MLAYTPGTEFDTLLRDQNPALRTAIEKAAPKLAALTAASKLFTTSAVAIETTPPEAIDPDHLADALLAGAPLPTDLVDQMTRQSIFETSMRGTIGLLSDVGGVLAGRITQTTIGAADAIRRNLHQQLTRCLAAIAELPVNVPRDPAAAIAARRVEEYERARQLLDEHHAIRDAQRQVNAKLHLQDSSLGPVRPAEVLFSTPDNAFDDWVGWRRFGYLVDQYGRKHHLTPPWPTDISSDDFAIWSAAHPEAGPWIPTSKEYAEHQTRITPLLSGQQQTTRSSTREVPAAGKEKLVLRMPDNSPRGGHSATMR